MEWGKNTYHEIRGLGLELSLENVGSDGLFRFLTAVLIHDHPTLACFLKCNLARLKPSFILRDENQRNRTMLTVGNWRLDRDDVSFDD